MKAMIIKDFGPAAEVFEATEIPTPTVQPGRVLIEVAASSVNPVDYKIRSGLLAAAAPDPRVLGCDVAGTIAEIGEGVERFKVGDQVYGCTGGSIGNPGALAEFQLADPDLLDHAPKNLPLADCAAVPLVAITAWEAIMRGANVREAETILVHGAAGGVGHIGVQLAKIRGAKVFATVSNDLKAGIALGYGATPVNYREQSVSEYVDEHTDGAGFDVVFDTIGGDNVLRSFEAAALEGRVASVNTRTECDLGLMHQKALSLHVVFMLIPLLHNRTEGRQRHGAILRQITDYIEAGDLKPLVHEQRFSFEDVASAHELLESGDAVGKIVLTGFAS